VHVGDDEVLLDDSRQYVERAIVAGVDATLDVWMGMAHGFTNAVGSMHAAKQERPVSGIEPPHIRRTRENNSSIHDFHC
jgi:epsilon-lactone hydrolase